MNEAKPRLTSIRIDRNTLERLNAAREKLSAKRKGHLAEYQDISMPDFLDEVIKVIEKAVDEV